MKLKLDIEALTENFFDDTRLLGIMVSAKSYRFCWQLNNMLGYNFRLNTDIEIHLRKKGRQYYFPVYQHAVHGSALSHFIYHNQYDGEYLLPEFKHMDFLWLIKGDCIPDAQCKELIQSVKNMNGVQLVAELTNEKIITKGNLVF
ncbi:MAG TPA: IPExxxVDY family protein [Panacibacter sp.]|nr:IPExxxVDY family protein [Panacibacter sp.]